MKEAVDIGRVLDAGRWSGYQKWIGLLAALTIIFDGMDIQLLGIAVPAIMNEWNVERGSFAPVLACALVGMGFGTVIAGMVGDRFGRRVALIGSVLVFGFFTLAIAWANDVWTLGVLRFCAGLGLGGGLPNAATLASEFVPARHRPLAVTLTIVCIPLGGAFAGLLGAEVLPTLGWRALFSIGGVASIAVALLLMVALPESPRFLVRHPHRWPELKRLLARIDSTLDTHAVFVDHSEPPVARPTPRLLLSGELRRDTMLIWAAFFCCMLSVYSGVSWLPTLLNEAGQGVGLASRGLAVFNLGGVVVALTAAVLITYCGSRGTLFGVGVLAVIGALALMATPLGVSTNPTVIIVLLAVTGGAINAVQTTLYAVAAHVFPTPVRATGVGSASGVGRVGALLSSFAGAWAIAHGGSVLFFALMAGAMVLNMVFLMMVGRHVPASVTGTNSG